MSRLRDLYREQAVPALMERFGYSSIMQVPRLQKVVLNMGVGEAAHDSKVMEGAVRDLMLISGQKPVITRAKKSISNFKIRAGMPIGCKVTLRGERMWDFVDKLIHIALPRIRDFSGLSPNGFDGRGNYSLGVNEQLIFPEIRYDDIERVRGMNITVVTTARTDEEALELLRLLGFPMRDRAA